MWGTVLWYALYPYLISSSPQSSKGSTVIILIWQTKRQAQGTECQITQSICGEVGFKPGLSDATALYCLHIAYFRPLTALENKMTLWRKCPTLINFTQSLQLPLLLLLPLLLWLLVLLSFSSTGMCFIPSLPVVEFKPRPHMCPAHLPHFLFFKFIYLATSVLGLSSCGSQAQ